MYFVFYIRNIQILGYTDYFIQKQNFCCVQAYSFPIISMSYICCGCANEKEAAIVESCGKFAEVRPAGCFFLIPCVDVIAAKVSLKIQFLEIDCETKTKDNVFVIVTIALQYCVIPDKVASAFYKLGDPTSQIKSCVYDVIRMTIPRLTLDDVFADRNVVANSIKERIQERLLEYGFQIVSTLMTNVSPDSGVKWAMNEVKGFIFLQFLHVCP